CAGRGTGDPLRAGIRGERDGEQDGRRQLRAQRLELLDALVVVRALRLADRRERELDECAQVGLFLDRTPCGDRGERGIERTTRPTAGALGPGRRGPVLALRA